MTKNDMKAYSLTSQKYVTTEPPYLLKSNSIDLFLHDSYYVLTGNWQHGQTIELELETFPGIDACWCILASA